MKGRKAHIRLKHPLTGEYYIGRRAGGMGKATLKLGPRSEAVVLTQLHLQYYLPRLKKHFGVDFEQEQEHETRTHLHPAEAGGAAVDGSKQDDLGHAEGDDRGGGV